MQSICIGVCIFRQGRIVDPAVERVGNALYCTFSRSFQDDVLKYTVGPDPQPYHVAFDFTEPQFIMLAWGTVYYGMCLITGDIFIYNSNISFCCHILCMWYEKYSHSDFFQSLYLVSLYPLSLSHTCIPYLSLPLPPYLPPFLPLTLSLPLPSVSLSNSHSYSLSLSLSLASFF